MNEAEWLTASDPQLMFAELGDRCTKRKWTLYLCAGLRCIWDQWLYSELSWKAVEVAERMADGLATEEEIRKTAYYAETPTFGYDFVPSHIRQGLGSQTDRKRLIEMGVYREEDIYSPRTRRIHGESRMDQIKGVNRDEYSDPDFANVYSADELGHPVVVGQLINAANIAEACFMTRTDQEIELLSRQRDWPGGWLLRDIFGNPFRPVVADPRWLTETAVGIARGIYDDRAFERLPILADALQDAGCENADLLTHCREPGTHVRGCWVVDLVLGKE